MTGREVTVLLEALRDIFGMPYGWVDLMRDESYLDSTTKDIGGKLSFHIGLQEMYDEPDRSFPIGEAMVPIMMYFHEVYGHGGQIKKEFEKSTALSRVLALNYYACRGSRHYYGFDDVGNPTDQYFRQPHEIAVQYVAIKCANRCLSDIYGKDEARDMILAFIDYRRELGSEFIDDDRKFTSVVDVLRCFDKTFRERVFQQRVYGTELPVKGYQDSIWDYAKFRKDGRFVNRVSNCEDGILQDAMMASVHAFMDRGEMARMLAHGSLRDIDLDPETVFKLKSRPPLRGPWKRSLGLRQLEDQSELTGLSEEQLEIVRKRMAMVRNAENTFGSVVSGTGPGGGPPGGPPGPGE